MYDTDYSSDELEYEIDEYEEKEDKTDSEYKEENNHNKKKSKTRISKVTGQMVTDYVDNTKFTQALLDYTNRQKEREKQGLPREKIPEYIGQAIIKIVNGTASRSNFRNYSYIDEMKSDAIEACVKAVHKFDINKSQNAFGFIGFCAWRVMVTRIKTEKKQHKIKEDMLLDPSFEFFEMMGNDSIQIDREQSINMYFGGKIND